MRPHRPVVRLLLLVAALLIARQAAADRRVSEEALLFKKLKSGVCTVYSEGGHGSGFLVDGRGIILTNDHVAGGSTRIRVKFDDSTRVEGLLLATDDKKDVAAVLVNPELLFGYAILPLAIPSDSMIFEGERVIAIGSPLNQEKIMTTGIVSKVEPTAIISDVNINHGNSGGPLINLDGSVVAINTFGDFTSQGGPGISGSINIGEAMPVLERARAALDTTKAPAPRRLPLPSRIPFPMDSLRVAAEIEKFDHRPYEVSDRVSTGKFQVVVVTPVYDAWRSWQASVALSKSTKKREAKGGSATSESSDPTKQMKEWMRYVGDDYAPIVTLQMTPKIGQTGGSIFGNILGALATGASGGSSYRGSYRYEFKADFLRAEVTRNDSLAEDFNMFRAMIPSVFASANWNGDYAMEDQARTGIMQCDPMMFAPENGVPPVIHVKVYSVEKPDKPYEFDLPQKTVQRVWDDFAAWRTISSTGITAGTH